ncbi:uncharacterized protein BCR38DRAFT_486947 [Pseudomassariella vexata]|uniref:Uncharacterized protein n=1 Tax=Pseudomassariella vexata TaxID=1141098 RepID=A0A1Y2DTT7_9PEZI|nr:uncharacterized protein BCR38DRAFT_486947 [Pseudomassariella vexata]ORY62693.1 hypothetical protein BCR38DRAFT_486947 [Pseudomassariella vexata]
MPLFFYHIKFELYPTAALDVATPAQSGDIWLPPKHHNIFDELPSNTPPVRRLQELRCQATAIDVLEPKATSKQNIIDCGAPRPPPATEDHRNIVVLSEQQLRQRTLSFPPPKHSASFKPEIAGRDWRFDRLSIESLDIMAGEGSSAATAIGPSMSSAGKATKAKYIPFKTKTTNIGWGIVHLYRESVETLELDAAPGVKEGDIHDEEQLDKVDCTTVCIPAVPSYLSPSDFLGFIGDKFRDQVSHYRMVMTGRLNRYLVLMKFRNSQQAQRFKTEFDGKVFNTIEPETCNVAFIRSINFETPSRPNGSFPDLSYDPFTPSSSAATAGLKPFPPPTPNLIELPTCPVCLERMDETTGLLTILCQHVFHCSCLQKWKGSGCPVCRHTNPSLSMPNGTDSTNTSYSSSSASRSNTAYDPSNTYTQPFGSHVSNLCSVCDSPEDLWICLICGNVGCGRYKGGHAKDHWKETAHTFSLELDTQHVWDYAGDMWVHRLIRDKGDGKVVELPGHRDGPHRPGEDEDVVPRAKLESIGMEYTHLLTSQLESQRVYFEKLVNKAADKAAKASAAAEKAAAQVSETLQELRALKEVNRTMTTETIPSFEKDLERERTRATKATDLARKLGSGLQEEKEVSEGLLKRIEHINKEVESLGQQVKILTLENADLKDQNHDLTMFISGQEKLKEMEAEGQVAQEDLQEGTASVGKRKGKGRAKR